MATRQPKSQIINGQRILPKTQIVGGERVPVNQQPTPLQTPPTMAQNAPTQAVNTPINQVPMSALAQPATPIQVPTPTQATQPSTFVSNLQPAIQQGQQGLITAQTKEAEQRNNLLNRLMERDVAPTQDTYTSAFNQQISKMTGKRPEEFLQSLTDANTQLATLQGKFRTAGQAVSGAQGQSKVFEGVQLGELDRQSAVEVGNQALLVQALQGNFDTARQIALDTANFATEDRKMELNNLLAQYDAISGIVEGQEAQLLQQERDRVEAEKAKLERTQKAVDAAIMSGGATVQDMQKLTSTTISDDEKLAIAQSIVSRTAGEDRGVERAIKYEQLKALRAPKEATRSTQIIDVDGVKQLVDTQTGEVVATFEAGTTTNQIEVARDTAFVNNVDTLKTHSGLNSSVGPNALTRTALADQFGAKQEFIGSTENVVKNLTLNTFAEAKAKGMTFGAMTEEEWRMLGESATKISNWRVIDEKTNQVTGYNIDEKRFKKELDSISNFGKMDAIRKGAAPSDIGVQIINGEYWTQNSDGTFTQLDIMPR